MSGLVSAFAMSGLEGGRAGTTLDDAVAQYEGGIYDQRSGALPSFCFRFCCCCCSPADGDGDGDGVRMLFSDCCFSALCCCLLIWCFFSLSLSLSLSLFSLSLSFLSLSLSGLSEAIERDRYCKHDRQLDGEAAGSRQDPAFCSLA